MRILEDYHHYERLHQYDKFRRNVVVAVVVIVVVVADIYVPASYCLGSDIVASVLCYFHYTLLLSRSYELSIEYLKRVLLLFEQTIHCQRCKDPTEGRETYSCTFLPQQYSLVFLTLCIVIQLTVDHAPSRGRRDGTRARGDTVTCPIDIST